MTEDEAKTKWCPMARVNKGVSTGNRVQIDEGEWLVAKGSTCLGSACMMWRWDGERNPDWKPMGSGGFPDHRHPDDIPRPWRPSTTQGNCGLAGRS